MTDASTTEAGSSQPGRPRTRVEAQYIRGPVWIDIPVPIRDNMQVVGFEWKSTDLVALIRDCAGFNPFLEAEGYYFDVDEFKRFIHFVINEIVYPEGINTGDPLVPELWQWSIYANIFCWKRESNDLRRFREVFIYVPRKNGKTTAFGMVTTLYEFYCGNEKRAQLFCCAADVEQASVNFRHTTYNIESNKRLINRLRDTKVRRSTRSFEHVDGTTFKVLSSIADTKHGLSPSFVYCDEVHAHKDSELIDVMITGMAARPQPLMIYTTTADYDRPSVCNALYERAKAITNGTQTDPTFLPVIFEALVEDDYTKESVWKKANPNYGKSIYAEHFERMIRTAENDPAELNRFLRLHLNVRTKTETTWIPGHVWAYGAPVMPQLLSLKEVKSWLYDHKLWHNITRSSHWHNNPAINLHIESHLNYYTWYINKIEDLKWSECYGGYDNASTQDIAAFTLWFPQERTMLFWGWCPGQSIYRKSSERNVPYSRWYEAGLLNDTPDVNISEVDIGRALIGYEDQPGIVPHFEGLQSVSFDRWGSNYIHETFSAYGINARAYPQSFAGMNQPCRQLQTMIGNQDFWHGGHPVLNWMIGNMMIEENRDEQLRPSRKNSSDKIDGIVSGLMAIGGWLYPEVETIHSINGLRD